MRTDTLLEVDFMYLKFWLYFVMALRGGAVSEGDPIEPPPIYR